jgi:WD40 repeat protein
MNTNATSNNQYTSYESLRAAHIELLRLQRSKGESDAVLQAGRLFVRLARATGVILDDDTARDSAQSLINYWVTTLYSAGIETGESELADFDENQAPDLKGVDCPYRGLSAFSESDDTVFFGRQKLVNSLLEHLADRHLLVVAGPSGSGKSSVVRAGVVPALKKGSLPGSENWRCLSAIVPGSHPLESLAQLFCRDDTEVECWATEQIPNLLADPQTLAKLVEKTWNNDVVMVVDQFEETFTLCDDENERKAFVANLQALFEQPQHQHRLILTLRSDFENKVALLPDFQPLFEANLVRVVPLTAAELRQAIEEPAHQVGLKFEAGVVESLVGDVLGEPAALPLLQFSLLQLWEKRERNRVTLAAYRRVGGGREALERAADELYGGFIEQYKIATRLILLRLVRPSLGLEVTSQRVRRSHLFVKSVSPDSINYTLERLIKARLLRLTPGRKPEDDQVEVAHEALVRNWRKLLEWLDEERERIRQRQRLTIAAENWREYERDADLLLRGVELIAAQQYDDLNKLEAEFVQASLDAEENIRLKAESEANRLRTLNRRIGVMAGVAFIIAMLAILLGFQARSDRQMAEIQSTRAVAQAATAEMAQSYAEKNAELAISAQRTSDAQTILLATANAETQNKAKDLTLSEATANQNANIFKALFLGAHSANLTSQGIDPDVSLLLGIAAMNIYSDTFEARNGLASSLSAYPRLIKFLWGIQDPISAIVRSPQGHFLAAASSTGEFTLWDVQNPLEAAILARKDISPNSSLGITRLAISNDEGFLATLVQKDKSGTLGLQLWDIHVPSEPQMIGYNENIPLTATSSTTPTQLLVDGYTYIPLFHEPTLAFSPDSKLLATTDSLGMVTLWDASKPNSVLPLHTWKAHQGLLTDVTFITYTITETNTTAVALVSVGCVGAEINPAISFSLPPVQDDINPCSQGDVVVWNVDNPQSPQPLGGLLNATNTFDPSYYYGDYYPNNYITKALWVSSKNLLVVSTNNSELYLVDLQDPRSPQWFDSTSFYTLPTSAWAISPDNGRFIVTDSSGSITFWRMDDLVALDHSNVNIIIRNSLNALAIADDAGEIVVTGESRSGLQMWDVKGQSTERLKRQEFESFTGNYGFGVAFHPTQSWIATNNSGDGIRLWDYSNPDTPRLISHFARYNSYNYAGKLAFDSTGQFLFFTEQFLEIYDLSDPLYPRKLRLPSEIEDNITYPVVSLQPNGDLFAIGAPDSTLQLWRITSPDILTLVGSLSPVFSNLTSFDTLSFNSDGSRLAIADAYGQVAVLDVSNPVAPIIIRPAWQAAINWANTGIETIALSSDGDTLLSVGCQQECTAPSLQLWDLRPKTPQLLAEHSVPHNAIYSLAYSPDGRLAATSDQAGWIALWDMSTFTSTQPISYTLTEQKAWIDQVVFHPSSHLLAATSDDLSTLIYQVSSAGAQRYRFIWPKPDSPTFDQLVSSGDGKLMVTAHRSYDYYDNSKILIWDIPDEITPTLPTIAATIPVSATTLALSRNGLWLAAANEGGQMYLWQLADANQPKLIYQWQNRQNSMVISMVFSPNQRWLVTTNDDLTLRVWDLQTDGPTPKSYPLWISAASLGAVTMSEDGSRLFLGVCVGSGDNTCQEAALQIYDFSDPTQPRLIAPEPLSPAGHVLQILAQPNGNMLVVLTRSPNDDSLRFVSFWSLRKDGKLSQIGDVIQGGYSQLAFRKDGLRLAIGSIYGTIQLAETNIQQMAARPKLFALTQLAQSMVTGLVFVGENTTLLATSPNAILVQSIEYDPLQMLETACQIVNRNFSQEEWHEYIPMDDKYRPICPNLPEYLPELELP